MYLWGEYRKHGFLWKKSNKKKREEKTKAKLADMLWLRRSSCAAPITWNDPRKINLHYCFSSQSGNSKFQLMLKIRSDSTRVKISPVQISFLQLLVLLIEIPASIRNVDPTFGVPIFYFFTPDAPDVWTFASGERRRRDQTGWLSIIRTPRPLSEENNPSAEEWEFASGVYAALM